jgi:hypothetical protein
VFHSLKLPKIVDLCGGGDKLRWIPGSCLIKKKWRFGFKTPNYGIITQRAKRLWLFLGSQLAYKKQN